jgi:hypothetical protein
MEGGITDLDNGQTVAKKGLQQGDDSADKKHGADDFRQIVGINTFI